MKKIITPLVFVLVCSVTYAQEVKLTVETTAGGLKDALTKEQKQTVTDLTLTGSMNDSDFYLIRDSMPKLEQLDLKYVDVDTIPKKGFYGSRCGRCVLPIALKYIGDNAFKKTYCSVIITGEFPKLGRDIFENDVDSRQFFYLSSDNKYCKQQYEGIYSIDGKVFYFQQSNYAYVEEGVETIESGAFDGASYIHSIELPSTLKLIKEFCFANTFFRMVSRSYEYYDMSVLVCKAVIPPVLEDSAFVDERLFEGSLVVPTASMDLYKQSNSQWSKFSEITDTWNSRGSIENNPNHSLITTKEGNGWNIKAEKRIHSVLVTTSSGIPCKYNNLDYNRFYVPSVQSHKMYLINIRFEDGTAASLKLLNPQ